jgi:hypothetical protein
MPKLRFHPLSHTPLIESQRRMRGHNFYPPAAVLRRLGKPGARGLDPAKAPCVVYFGRPGRIVVTAIDPETLNAYGWTCLDSQPDGAEWGDVGSLLELEAHRAPFPGWLWERDLFSDDANAAAAVARIRELYTARYAPS